MEAKGVIRFGLAMPSLNQAEFIRESVESVLVQEYPHFDLVICDGGSDDGTVEILGGLPDRVKWVSEPDRGQSDAINKAWGMTDGDVLTWVNSDDLLADPGVLSRVAAIMQDKPEVDIVVGDYEVVGPNGETLFRRWQAPFHGPTLKYCNNFIVPAAFIRRRVLDHIGQLDVSLRWTMDIDLWLRALAAGAKFEVLMAPMWKHRFHERSNTVSGRGEMTQEFRRCQQEWWPEWLTKGGWVSRTAAAGLRALLRLRTQGAKLLTRRRVDNLLRSFVVRRRMAP